MDLDAPNTDKVEDEEFDVVVQGTGMEECMAAAALGRSGFTVLHLDDNAMYGGDWAGMTFAQFTAAVEASGGDVVSPPHAAVTREALAKKRGWNIDVSPRGVAAGGFLVDTLVASNTARYLEFKNVDRSLFYRDGAFCDIPSGRSDIFKTKHLAPMEKRRLMQLIQYCGGADDDEAAGDDSPSPTGAASSQAKTGPSAVPAEWRERPAAEFLKTHLKFSERLASLVLHAIIGLDGGAADDAVTAVEAVARLTTIAASVGKYGPTHLIYPNYGVGDLSQAFVRVCAIYKGVYILRRGVRTVATDEAGAVASVTDSAGQTFRCKHFLTSRAAWGYPRAAGPSAQDRLDRAVVFSSTPLLANTPGGPEDEGDSKYSTLVAKITPGSLGDGLPSRTVTVFELSASTNSCPSGLYTLHFTQAAAASGGDDVAPQAELRAVVSRFVDVDGACFVGASKAEAAEGTGEDEAAAAAAAVAAKPVHLVAFFTTPSQLSAGTEAAHVVCRTHGGDAVAADAALPDGVRLCGAPTSDVDVDAAMRRAKGVWGEVLQREATLRGM